MTVENVHERTLNCAASKAGRLIDTLSSSADQLWPHETWPPMRFDRPLEVGARGGHGPIRYHVSQYRPGRSVRFTFDGPGGFDGFHQFDVIGTSPSTCVLRHTLAMTVHGPARLTWPIAFRPLHDALIEAALHKACAQLQQHPAAPPAWSIYVRTLRAVARRILESPSRQPTPVT